jgi:nitroimidazol reductase NimA-like FMN-containing flavoprotein (pyridoxamine 5'-phosphate oxidase superfamily)
MSNSRYEELSAEQCWQLLDATRFGRLATCIAGEPDIFPVNFLVHDGTIVMRTAPGTKLAEVVISKVVAVEADEVAGDQAWSVIAKGQARVVETLSESYELDAEQLQTWLPEDKPIYVVITVTDMSGRRFFRDLTD